MPGRLSIVVYENDFGEKDSGFLEGKQGEETENHTR
jgi:hypothetical protein